MTSYVDTLIIDCNVASSEQNRVSEDTQQSPAVFTCRQGSGLKLNPGDEISVHSAMINEKGNNGNIEFSGITQPSRTYLLEYSKWSDRV